MNKGPRGIRELAEEARQRGALDLALGAIDMPPPACLVQAVSKAANHSYADRHGVAAYRDAITDTLRAKGWNVTREQIVASSGATGGIASALLADCRPGDTVLLPQPFFTGTNHLLETLGFKVQYWSLPIGQAANWDELESMLSKVKAVVLSSPANPTGHVASTEIVQKLARAAKKTGCLLIMDEIYRDFIWDQLSSMDDAAYNELEWSSLVIVRSFSKMYAIPGWRIGYAISSPERVDRMARANDGLYLGGSILAQDALGSVLSQHAAELAAFIVEARSLIQRNIRILSDAFAKIGMAPQPVAGAYYMLVQHHMSSDWDAANFLLDKNIAVVPACILYADAEKSSGYIRINCAVSSITADLVVDALARTAL